MGFSLNVQGGKYVRVGGYGSQVTLTSLLLAGYAAGKFPESERSRRWIDRVNKWEDASVPANIPTNFFITRSVRDLNELIAFNHNDANWITFQTTFGRDQKPTRTIDRGLKLKPITCPILAGIVSLYKAVALHEGFNDIPAQDVPAVADSIRHVLPLLDKSCWFAKVSDVGDVFQEAKVKKTHVVAG